MAIQPIEDESNNAHLVAMGIRMDKKHLTCSAYNITNIYFASKEISLHELVEVVGLVVHNRKSDNAFYGVILRDYDYRYQEVKVNSDAARMIYSICAHETGGKIYGPGNMNEKIKYIETSSKTIIEDKPELKRLLNDNTTYDYAW